METYIVRIVDSDYCVVRTKVDAASAIDVVKSVISSKMYDEIIRGDVVEFEIYKERE